MINGKIGFCSLGSGSKGNCLFLGSPGTKILIDAGLSGKAIIERLLTLGIAISEIDAILVTHDHTDHILGLKVLAFKYGIPVLANRETAKGIVEAFQVCPKFKIFTTGETFEFGDLEIHPFSIQHDTLDPVAFTIKTAGVKIGICTDLGFVTTLVRTHLKDCDYLHIEANHEPDWVHACSRPMVYKQRVLGKNGHLSNGQCADLLVSVAHCNLKHVHLAHLSSECNSKDKALSVIQEILGSHGISFPLSVAPQDTLGTPISFTNLP